MTKLLNNKYLLFGIICVLAVSIVLAFTAGSRETAHADYTEDILNNPEAIVNFNQIFYINSPTTTTYAGITMTTTNYTYTISGTATATDYLWAGVSGLYSSHHYYFNAYNSDIDIRVQNFSNHLSSPFIYTGDSNFNFAINYINGQTYDITIKPILIDLDLMFGSSNLPTLAQCQDIFIANYYTYNTGTPIKFNSLDSYSQGYNDAISSYDVTYDIQDFNTNVYALSGNLNFSNDYSFSYQSVNFTRDIAFPLGFNFVKGDLYTITLRGVEFYSYENLPTGNFYVGYLDNNNNFVPFYSLTHSDMTNNSSGTYFVYDAPSTLTISGIVPDNLSTIVFRYQYSGSITAPATRDDYWCRIGAFSLVGKTYNATYSAKISYSQGYKDAETNYASQLESYTSDTGAGYQRIYELGYQAGQNASVSAARKKTYTFTAFLGALFDVPVSTIKSLLDFNFLGFNLKNFVFSLLTLSIVFALIKFILVKSSSGGDK